MWIVVEHEVAAPLGVDAWAPLKEGVRYCREKWPKMNFKLLRSENLGSSKIWLIYEAKSMAEYEAWMKDYWASKWWTDFWERTVKKSKGPDGLTSWNYRLTYFDEVPLE